MDCSSCTTYTHNARLNVNTDQNNLFGRLYSNTGQGVPDIISPAWQIGFPSVAATAEALHFKCMTPLPTPARHFQFSAFKASAGEVA